MANTDNPNGFTFVRSLVGHGELEDFTLDTNQTISKGDALEFDPIQGRVQLATSSSESIHAIAAEAETTTSSTATIKAYPALPWYIFEIQTSGTFAAADIGNLFDIEGSTGVMEVNEDSCKYGVVQILGYNPNDSVGANTRVYVKIAKSSYAGGVYGSIPDGANVQAISTNTTLDAADSGYWNVITASTDVTVTLPATAVGIVYNFIFGLPAGSIKTSLSPQAGDKIMGIGNAGTDGMDMILTKATARTGDKWTLIADGSAGWYVVEAVGTFSFQTS